MSKCKFARIENDAIVRYDCNQVRILSDKWKEDFRIINKVNEMKKDTYYERYCESIDKFIDQCKCLDENCDKCTPEDHEGLFCRCESRNIALAKKLRKESYKKVDY